MIFNNQVSKLLENHLPRKLLKVRPFELNITLLDRAWIRSITEEKWVHFVELCEAAKSIDISDWC